MFRHSFATYLIEEGVDVSCVQQILGLSLIHICQFCTRQRLTRSGEISLDNFGKILAYIKEHSEIEDILVTGGDPLILNTSKIVAILQELEKIDSIKIMRIGTRIPITLPQRINTELIQALKMFNHLYIKDVYKRQAI